MNRFDQLRDWLRETGERGVCLAFSGGVDSALLLAELAEVVPREKLLAITFHSELQEAQEPELARALAERCRVRHELLRVELFADDALRFNPPDRCYRCKHRLFETLIRRAAEAGLATVLDGTNADDLNVHRPGRRALAELGVKSPLAAFGIAKAEVRERARALGLPVANRPAAPCLATRLPYGAELAPELLRRIEAGETWLKERGMATVRLRIHGEVARVEVPTADFPAVLGWRNELIAALNALNFRYITLDLEGFRSGSMDREV